MTRTTKRSNWLPMLILLTTVTLSLGCLPAVFTDPVPTGWLTWGYFLLAYVSQNFLFSLLFSLLLWPIFLLIRSDRVKIACVSLLITAFLSFFIISTKVYAFWHFYLNKPVFDLFFSEGGGANVFEISSQMMLTIVLVVLLLLFLGAFLAVFAKWLSQKIKIRFIFLGLVAIYCFIQTATIFFIRHDRMRFLGYTIKSPYFMTLSWANGLSQLGLAIYPKSTLTTELKTVLSYKAPLHYPLHPLQYQVQKPLNVLFIVLDTLRYDMINPVNMPNVFKFSQQADRFTHHISGGDCTRAGIFSLFYGIPVTYWDNVIANQQGSILIRAFQQNHYQFYLLGSAGFLSPPFARSVFESVKHLQVLMPGKTPWQRDQEITADMQRFLDQQKNASHPFFGFLFYDAPHAYNALGFSKPATPVASMNYFTVSNATDPKPLKNLYENAVFADDQLVGHVIQTLKNNELLKNTIVIITADHGQEFNEYHNNYWEHPSGFSKYQIRTPFIMAWPGHKPATYAYQTTHYDVVPTLLKHVLGVSNPDDDYSVGHDMYQHAKPYPVLIGQYGQFALDTKQVIMPFENSGIYRFTDKTMRPISQSHLDQRDRFNLLKTLWWFY